MVHPAVAEEAEGVADGRAPSAVCSYIHSTGSCMHPVNNNLLPMSRYVTTLTMCYLGMTLFAQSGALDLSFGGGDGMDVPGFPSDLVCTDMVVQPNDRIICACTRDLIDTNITLIRRLPDGGTDLAITTEIGERRSEGLTVALQPDGKILIGGGASTNDIHGDMCLVRYMPDGTLDPSFGEGGIVLQPMNPIGYERIVSLIVLPDGAILAAVKTVGDDALFTLARFTPDGALDPTFGTAGIASLQVGNSSWISSIALQSDGRIVAVGLTDIGPDSKHGIARFMPDGSPDLTFMNNGWTSTEVGSAGLYSVSHASIVAIDQSDNIVVGGRWRDANNNWRATLLRYTPEGELDSTYNSHVSQSEVLPGASGGTVDLLVLSDGAVVVGGDRTNGWAWQVHRYLFDGHDDLTFGDEGVSYVAHSDPPGDLAHCQALALQSTGKLLLAGNTWDGPGTERLQIMRLDNTLNGVPDGALAQPELNVHPNPASDLLTLNAPSREPMEVVISEVTGQVARTFTNVFSGARLDVGTLAPGSYFISGTGPQNARPVKFVIAR